MNERIYELAVQAKIQMVSEPRLQEFAELIIKECANELIKWKDEPFPYDPEFGASLIKQHFGVKE